MRRHTEDVKTDSNGDMKSKDKRDSSTEGSLMGKDKEEEREGGCEDGD